MRVYEDEERIDHETASVQTDTIVGCFPLRLPSSTWSTEKESSSSNSPKSGGTYRPGILYLSSQYSGVFLSSQPAEGDDAGLSKSPNLCLLSCDSRDVETRDTYISAARCTPPLPAHGCLQLYLLRCPSPDLS